MSNTQVQEGRLIASSRRQRLVYGLNEQKGIHPAARMPLALRPSSHKDRAKKSWATKTVGVGGR